MTTHKLYLDTETYNPDPHATDNGNHKYAEGGELLVIAYSVDGAAPEVIDMMGDKAKLSDFLRIYYNPEYEKIAHNAEFDVCMISAYHRLSLPPEEITDTAEMAARNGYPRGLDKLGPLLGIAKDERKDKAGKELIKLFSKPHKPDKTHAEEYRICPADRPEEWEQFKSYCRQDVIALIAIYARLKEMDDCPEWEHQVEILDRMMNRRGVMIDEDMVKAVIRRKEIDDEIMGAKFAAITELKHTQTRAFKDWLSDRLAEYPDITINDVQEETVKSLLSRGDIPEDAREALEIRQIIGGAANAKYYRMLSAECGDGRVRDMFQYWGAETGRWVSKRVQLQNLARNDVEELDSLRELAKAGEYDMIELLFGPCSRMFKQLVRTAFIAKPGHQFIVFDFSAIEARVAAWVCGVEWKLEAFREGHDIYCETAKQMFNLPECTKQTTAPDGTHYRAMGKVAELAYGYGGSVNAGRNMDKTHTLSDETLLDMCRKWRDANAEIRDYWYQAEKECRQVIERGGWIESKKGIQIGSKDGALVIMLPSERCIKYRDAAVQATGQMRNRRAETRIYYTSPEGIRKSTYGASIFESIVQGIARDCLALAMLKTDRPGREIVMHIHDEMVVEVPEEDVETAYAAIDEIMRTPPEWAKDLPIKGAGYVTPYYKKD